MNVLVTGGAGFIGSHLVDALMQDNDITEVRVLDNLETGNLENIKHHKNNPKFSFIEGNIRDLKTCIEATKDIQGIFHQAALGSVPRSIDDPITSHEVNVTGTINILEAARKNNVKRVVYASSSSVYGTDETPQKIETKMGKPLSPYAVTKVMNEYNAINYGTVYDLETIGLRYFNVFGPRQNPQGPYAAVIPIFITKLLNNEAPTINGDGSISRDFTYVANVVAANITAMKTTNKEALGQVYNIALGGSINLNELYKTIKESLNSTIEAKHGEPRKGDILHSCANVDKAKELLNFKGVVTVKDGLASTCLWYKLNHKSN